MNILQIIDQMIEKLEGQDLSRLEQVKQESEDAYRVITASLEKPESVTLDDDKPQAEVDQNLSPAEFGR